MNRRTFMASVGVAAFSGCVSIYEDDGDGSNGGGGDGGGAGDDGDGSSTDDGSDDGNDTDDDPRTYAFEVVVQESEGAYGLEGVEVTVSEGGEAIARGETNIDGIAEFRLPAGEYTLSIEDVEGFEDPGEASVNVPDAENYHFSLVELEQEEPPDDGNESEPPAGDGNESDPYETRVPGVLR